MHEDRHAPADAVVDRLQHEVEIGVVAPAIAVAVIRHEQFGADERLAGGVDLIEQGDHALPRDIGKQFRHGTPDDGVIRMPRDL